MCVMAKKPQKTSKARKNKKKKPGAFKQGFKAISSFISDERLHKSIGLSFVLFSLFLCISFISFLFTWDNDQAAIVGTSGWDFLMFSQPVPPIENWLGKLGALTAHVFMYKWFGLASFAFAVVLFVGGFRILFKTTILPIGKTLKFSLFGLIWFSVALGGVNMATVNEVTGTAVKLNLGGVFGFESANWLTAFAGNIGRIAILAFSMFGFIVVAFNPSFAWVKALFNKPEKEGELHKDFNDVEEGVIIPLDAEVKNPGLEESEDPIEVDTAVELEPSVSAEELNDIEDDDFSVEVAGTAEAELSEKELNDKVKEFGEYDPTLELSDYKLPPIDLLNDYGATEGISVNKEELEANKNRIIETLLNYKIEIQKIKATIGPTVTLYEIVPAPGVRISKIKNLESDIALSLAALGIRIIAPIPGKGTIGIEVPNSKPDTVSMRSLIASEKFQNNNMELPIAMGKTISNENYVFDLTKTPHVLMAGATGQGKSVGLNAILASLLYKKHPSQVKFVLVDPKKVELTLFNKIERHFLAKLPNEEEAIINDTSKVVYTVNSLCTEMDQRYELLKNAQVRNIKEYNTKFVDRKLNPEKGHRYLPYIVLVIDEFADLIMTAGKEIETPIARLAQLARAIGIHLIVATQRPSANIITGVIKANFPTRIAFRVTSGIDSRTILDSGGADQLIGRGDMLISTGNDLIRLQCGFIDTPEVQAVCDFIGDQRGYPDALMLPEYIDENAIQGGIDLDERDAMFEDAARIVVTHQQGSASLLQRKLKLGYNRAGRIVDQLEAAGIIGPFEGSKARKVLVQDEMQLHLILNPPDSDEGMTESGAA